MRNESRGIFNLIEVYVDIIMNLISVIVGYYIVTSFIYEPMIDLINPYTIIIIFVDMSIVSFVYHAFGMYKTYRYQRFFHSFPVVIKSNTAFYGMIAILVAFIARTGYKEFLLVWILFAMAFSTAMITSKRHFIKVIVAVFLDQKNNSKRIIIVGDNTDAALEYLNEVRSNNIPYGMKILGVVGNRIDERVLGATKLGSSADLERVIEEHAPTDVVFAIDSYDKAKLIKLVNICDDHCVKVYFLPVIFDFFKSYRQIEQRGRLPIINAHSTPLDNLGNAALKRIIDIFGSIILIIFTMPIMIFAAIGVKISSPGPVFFKQKRVGKLGKPFTMLKFRSMRVNEDSDSVWTTDDDPRKTKFGNFLRKTSIDELPQLFNVFVGTMSLVGPRPEIPVFVEYFKEQIPLYMIKHYVKPGMTGLAQIKGLRGDTSVEERIHADIEYIESWTLWHDIYILLKTPFKAINKNERYVEVEEKSSKKDAENE